MFLDGTDRSKWMLLSQLWDWMEKSLPLNPMCLGLCIQICLQVQNFVELVQKSWLVLAIPAKALQKHYVNTLSPAGGENAACGYVARSCCISAAHCNFLSSDLYLSPSWKTLDHFPPRIKSCWETIHRAISMEQWMCHQLCLCIVSSVAAVGVKLCKVGWPSREV